jgi:SAM-dependent methyltransferase
VGRVLKPGGTFVVTFSNRWFPPKVIRVWERIHEFERVGLVMEYFMRSGAYSDLGTYSMRGLPRPRDDKYAGELLCQTRCTRYGEPERSNNRKLVCTDGGPI